MPSKHSRRPRGGAAPSTIHPGARARIEGLKSRPELNGRTCSILHEDEEQRKWAVRCEGSDETEYIVKHHLKPIDAPRPPDQLARLTKEVQTLKTAEKLNEEAEECAICLEDFSSGIKEQLGCGHVFHRACLDGAQAMTCPMCRQWDGSVNGSNWAQLNGGACEWWKSDPLYIQWQILGYVYQARSHQDGCDPSEEEEQAFIVQCLRHAMRQDPFAPGEMKITDANQDFHVLRENFILALKLNKLIRSLAVKVDGSEREAQVDRAVEERLNLDSSATFMAVSVAVSRVMAALLDDPAYAPFVDAWLLSAAMPPAAQAEILIEMIEPPRLPRFKHSLWDRNFLALDRVSAVREAVKRRLNPGPHSRRFPIGATVECCLGDQWAEGTVVGHHYREPSWEADGCAPYQVQLSGTIDGEENPLIYAPNDTDECIRGKLRFGVGDAVQCFLEGGWVPGKVLKLYHREPGWTDPKQWAPYQVRLEPERWGEDTTIYALVDTDECVRALPP